MKHIKTIAVLLSALSYSLASGLVYAEPVVFKIAASSSSGTYEAGLKEIQTMCSTTEFNIESVVKEGTGATENLAQLVNNEVSGAFLHSDVIQASADVDAKFRQYKTLISLYPEEIHIVALRVAKETTGGIAGFNAQLVVYAKLSDLKGRMVGAAGGGVVTANRLAKQGEGGFKVVIFNSGKEVMDALKAGQIQAALFVGGSPLAKIAELPAEQFKLLPIDEAITAKVSGLYQSATIDYTNLKSGPTKTLSTAAVIVTRPYKTQKMIALQSQFRTCFYEHLAELQETTGMHRKWSEVDPEDHGPWEWLELPK